MEGRSYKVDLLYGHTPSNFRVEEAVRSAIRIHLHETEGDVLVFLTGSDECEMSVKLTYQKLQVLLDEGKEVPSCLIYALYGAQSADDQAQVFQKAPEDTRKIIYATNIAETSITIDGIGFVVDCGHVKQKQYNPKTGMDRLVVVPISKVQAIQRAGRAGRTQEGKCYRMYSEKFYKEQMCDTTVPEILRVNLCSLILTLKCIGVDDVLKFDYMERPNDQLILKALRQLVMLDALRESGRLTSFGKELCKYPMEPHYSKSLMMAKFLKCEDALLTVRSRLKPRLWQPCPRRTYG
jgi:ATP-dependent RNA helicase DHX8/PRP22